MKGEWWAEALVLDRTEPRMAPRSEPVPRVRCLGQFSLWLDGDEVDLSTVKPRVRSLLRYLATRAGAPVHRDSLAAALWPHLPSTAALHNLQVALSSLRRLLEPEADRGHCAWLARSADTYRLDLPPESDVDLWTFDRERRRAKALTDVGDAAGAIVSYRNALAAYSGPLLVEEGSSEWVVEARASTAHAAAEAGVALARLQAARADLDGAAEACEFALSVDQYRDQAWRLLIDIAERRGDLATEARLRHRYRAMLTELGVADTDQRQVI